MPKTLQGVGCWNSYEKSFSNRTTLKNSRQMSYSRNAGRAKGSGAVVSPSVRTSSERNITQPDICIRPTHLPDRDPFLELIGSSVAGAELGVDQIVQQKMTEDPRYV